MSSDTPSGSTHPRSHPILWPMALAAILYLSLHPFSGWMLRHPSPWSWLSAGLPRFYSWGDLIVNVGAYAGFGYLTVRHFQRRLGLWGAILTATAGATLLSFSMESIQSYLPRRVPSLMDLITNGGGAWLGALLVVPMTRSIRVQHLRRRFCQLLPENGSEYLHRRLSALLLLLWLLGQIVPQQLPLVVGPLSPWPGQALLPALPLAGALPAWATPLTSILLVTASILLPALLLMQCMTQPAHRLLAWLLLLITALCLRLAAAWHLYIGAHRLQHDLPVLFAALVAALLGYRWLVRQGRQRQRALALGLVAICLGLAWLSPPEMALQPLLRKSLTTYMRMATPGFRGLLHLVACWWPLAALYFFVMQAPNSSGRRPRPAASVNHFTH
ncbi:MAG: VanZ family protein [Lautropia sp.]|nr:VanZ family protein [Lautropia sp.]